jgi:phosphoribosylamine--glycine ligase
MASHGYPDEYKIGKQIFGLEHIKAEDGVVVFHAGTKKEGSAIVSSGGRVLGVTAIGFNNELEQTIQNTYHAVGKKALKHLQSK